jgi:hypothetical protein
MFVSYRNAKTIIIKHIDTILSLLTPYIVKGRCCSARLEICELSSNIQDFI